MYIVANWKSHKNIQQSLEWLDQVGPTLEHNPDVKIIVCPSFHIISELKKASLVGHFPVEIGTQNISEQDEGAFTGEIAAIQLMDLVKYTIIGHSERRNLFNESDEVLAQKVKRAIEYKILPIFCVQDANTSIPTDVKIVAYEPVFAIGTGQSDTPSNANEVAKTLKKLRPEIEVLYGGSVSSENVKKFLEEEQIDGVLIGGASLDPVEFSKITEIVNYIFK